MAKYSSTFKLQVVREYLDGPLGYRLLASKYGIKSSTQLRNWVSVYKKHGAAGLNRKTIKEAYSVQFKM
ncbi:transposase, partial [Virgibacillus sediminis]